MSNIYTTIIFTKMWSREGPKNERRLIDLINIFFPILFGDESAKIIRRACLIFLYELVSIFRKSWPPDWDPF